MIGAELIDKLINTAEFKNLQALGLKLHDNQRQFDLLSVYNDLIDEMAWSRLFAYLLDSTEAHGLSQVTLRKLLGQIPQLKTFCKSLPLEADTKTICVTEWKTEKGRRIDILVKLIDKTGNIKAVIGIENKLDSGEQNNQIRDYQKSLIHEFPRIPKVLLYLTPNGRVTETADENTQCSCYAVSFNIISNICEQVIPNTQGQAQIFLSILKTHIDKLTNRHIMDNEAVQLIRNLYKNSEYRQAIKLIGQYSPNVRHLFEDISLSILKSKALPFTPRAGSIEYYPKTSPNPSEFKIYPDELIEIGQKKGLYACYILRCENPEPDFEDVFTLRLAIWYANLGGKDATARQAVREKIQNAFSFHNSLGTNKNWSQWICIWTGDSYKLSDMGNDDITGLKTLLLKGINNTFQEYKTGLQKIAKSII